MSKFWIEFWLGVNTVSLLPCWLLAALLHRWDHGHWRYVPPDQYADNAAEKRDWVCLFIAAVCWALTVAAVIVVRNMFL